MKIYPLIGLKKSKQPSFWVYNNYAFVYNYYLESLKKEPLFYRMGDYESKPKLDESLIIKLSVNQNLKGIHFIENESFEWVEQVYYPHMVETDPSPNWIFSDYTINCFSANYELKESLTRGFLDDDEIYNIEVYDFQGAGLYPDSQKLNLLVKEYFRNIKMANLESFLNFHFNNCYDAFKFLVHVIEITDDIWSYAVNDIECKKVFKKWIKDKIKFLEISNPQVLIDIYTNQKKIDYDNQYFEEDLHGNLHLDIYGEPVSLSVPFEVFYNAKLEVKIYEFFQLNEIPTPEPPQSQDNKTKHSLTLSTRHGAKTAIYYAFKQLIDLKIIANNATEVARFLIHNVKGFEDSNPKDLATEIGRERNREMKNGKTEPKTTNKVDLEGF